MALTINWKHKPGEVTPAGKMAIALANTGKHVYGGTVPDAVKAKRRATNKAARKASPGRSAVGSMSMNMDIAVRHLNSPVEQLRQDDVIAAQAFAKAMGDRDFSRATTGLLGHFTRTERTRRQVQGDGPDWTEALASFEAAVLHHIATSWAATRSPAAQEPLNPGGVNAAPLSVLTYDGDGAKDTHEAAPDFPAAGATCAPGAPHLQLVPPPACGEVGAIAHMRCVSPAGHAYGHYFRSSTGSDVVSKHGVDQVES